MARKKIRNWIAVTILFFSLIAIVITGFGTGGGGGLDSLRSNGGTQGEELARVGSVPITSDQVNNQFNQDFQNFRRSADGLANAQIGEFLNQNGFEGAVDRLVYLEAIRQFAAGHGIVATRQMIDNAIYNAPDFRFARNGAEFDNNLFEQRLRDAGYTVERIRREVAEQLLQRQLLQPVVSGFRIPAGVARAYAAVPLEQRSGMIGMVPAAGIARGLNPTEAEVAQYYQRYRAYFTMPERRVIKYAVIGADQVTPAPVTESEIRAVYANTPRYQQNQTRNLQSITFSGAQAQQQAAAFAQRVRGGTAFVAAAQGAGFQESDVTFANQSQTQFAGVTSADVARQAFQAPQGGLVGPVRSPLGVHVVRVESVATSAGRPLEAVRADIVRELERRKRAVAVTALATQVEQLIDEGKSFEDAAREARLTIVTTSPLTAQGLEANGQPGTVSADLRILLPAAFEMDADSPDPVVAVVQENARFALLGVDRTDPAAPPPLAQIQGRVRAMLIQRLSLVRARQIADGIAARINGGMPVAQAFAQAGITLPAPQPVSARRGDIMRQQPQPPEALLLFFRLRPGTAEVARAPGNNGWVVVAPQQSVRAPEAAGAAILPRIQLELTQSVPVEAERQLLRAMALGFNVQRNEGAIRAARARAAASVAGAVQ
jgi:peptidyl-prolyl cis-trans isomerase D